MTVLERSEQTTAWELRTAWAKNQRVVLTLSERCMIRRIQGTLEHVAVTGAFVEIDGWHVLVAEILGVMPLPEKRPNRRQSLGDVVGIGEASAPAIPEEER